MCTARRSEKCHLVGQWNKVVSDFVQCTIQAGKGPEAVFILFGLVGFVNHQATLRAKRLEMAALVFVPAAHLIAHRFHLLGQSRASEE